MSLHHLYDKQFDYKLSLEFHRLMTKKISFLYSNNRVLLIENYHWMKPMILVEMDFHNNLNKFCQSVLLVGRLCYFVLKEDLMMIEVLHSNQKEFLGEEMNRNKRLKIDLNKPSCHGGRNNRIDCRGSETISD